MLKLRDLKLGLHDLFEKRHADLVKSKAGKFHEPTLIEQRDAIDALPPALTGGKPLADEIDALDGTHDGHGAVIFFMTEVYLRSPTADPAIVDAAKRIRDEFIPNLGELSASYVTEAERAMERRPLLKSMKVDLQLFPLAGGGTLLDTATAFLDAGESLHEKLSDRADMLQGSRKKAAALRPATIGALNRFRADLVREIKKDPKLPRDLEQKVFGYFDTLEGMHAAPPKAEPKPAPPAAPAAPEGPKDPNEGGGGP